MGTRERSWKRDLELLSRACGNYQCQTGQLARRMKDVAFKNFIDRFFP